MSGGYHNTTESIGRELATFESKAKSQETRILEFFRARPGDYAPSDLCAFVFENAVPLTSVRRAVSNLTEAGHLVKTERQHKGPYGRPEFLWRLADGQLRLL